MNSNDNPFHPNNPQPKGLIYNNDAEFAEGEALLKAHHVDDILPRDAKLPSNPDVVYEDSWTN